jgi:aminoglycoside phosphotransferase (APT) family kinase protein
VELTTELAGRVLAAAGLDGEVEAVSRRGEGTTAAVFEVTRAGAAPVVVKVYGGDRRWMLVKEQHVYELLAPLDGVPTPSVLHADGSGQVLPDAYAVLERLPGVPMSSVSGRLSDAQHEDLYRQIGALLRRIHAVQQPAFGYVVTRVVDPAPTNDEAMDRLFTRDLAQWQAHDGDPDLHAALTAHVAARRDLLAECTAPVLCHNDLHEANLLIEEAEPGAWRITGVVDVENALAGDPLLDLAKTDLYSINGKAAKLRGLLDGYGDPPGPGRWRERLALYRVYHALALWAWFASIGTRGPLNGLAAELRRLVA